MDLTQAWSKLFEVYTDGDNVWAMRGETMVAHARIGPDVDGPDAALASAAVVVASMAMQTVVA